MTAEAKREWRVLCVSVVRDGKRLGPESAAFARVMRRALPLRWLLFTPAFGVLLRPHWMPWVKWWRDNRTGERVLSFGAMLLAVSVVIPGRAAP